MEEYSFFKQIPKGELMIASLGIHSCEWESTTTKEFSVNRNPIIELMRKKSYDIIPAINKKGEYSHMVYSKKWGSYSDNDIEMCKINIKEDCIYYLTHIEDAIRLMAENRKYFYFLTNHSDIIGLLTLSNLNNKQFYYWFYQRFVDIEQGFGNMLNSVTKPDEILKRIDSYSSTQTDIGKWFSDSLKRYREDREKGVDALVTEYLYFGQFIELFKDLRLYNDLGYKNVNEFEINNSYLKEIRNIIAHPTRSLITDLDSLNKIWKGIVKMNEFVTRL